MVNTIEHMVLTPHILPCYWSKLEKLKNMLRVGELFKYHRIIVAERMGQLRWGVGTGEKLSGTIEEGSSGKMGHDMSAKQSR